MAWGALSDMIGRKPVVFIGCVGTITSLLLVGFAPNFWVALAGRVIGGALNGNIGTTPLQLRAFLVMTDDVQALYRRWLASW